MYRASSYRTMWLTTILSWFRHFVTMQGTSVLGQALQNISRKGVQRYVRHSHTTGHRLSNQRRLSRRSSLAVYRTRHVYGSWFVLANVY